MNNNISTFYKSLLGKQLPVYPQTKDFIINYFKLLKLAHYDINNK